MSYRLSDDPQDTTKAAHTTVHPCPYCENWQVDFHSETAQQWVEVRIVKNPKAGEIRDVISGKPKHGVIEEPEFIPELDTQPWYMALDQVIEEHMAQAHPAALAFFKATGRMLPATHT